MTVLDVGCGPGPARRGAGPPGDRLRRGRHQRAVHRGGHGRSRTARASATWCPSSGPMPGPWWATPASTRDTRAGVRRRHLAVPGRIRPGRPARRGRPPEPGAPTERCWPASGPPCAPAGGARCRRSRRTSRCAGWRTPTPSTPPAGSTTSRPSCMDADGIKADAELWTTCYTPRELRLLAERAGLAVDHVWSVTPGGYAAAAHHRQPRVPAGGPPPGLTRQPPGFRFCPTPRTRDIWGCPAVADVTSSAPGWSAWDRSPLYPPLTRGIPAAWKKPCAVA